MKVTRRRLLRHGLLFVAAGSAVVAMSSVAIANSTSLTYVALGDSYSSGEGNPGQGSASSFATAPYSWLSTSGQPSATSDGCDRSPYAYPVSVAHWMTSSQARRVTLRFLACSGSTTSDLWASPGPSVGLAPASGTEARQATPATLAGARLITLSIGGNDVYFINVISACLLGPPSQCSSSSTSSVVAHLTRNITRLEAVDVATFRHLRQLAPRASIFVVGYPDLLPTKATPSCLGLTAANLAFLTRAEILLDNVTQAAAAIAHVHYVNPNVGAASFRSHDVCSATSWFYSVNFVHLAYSFHPTRAGQSALSRSLEAALRTNDF